MPTTFQTPVGDVWLCAVCRVCVRYVTRTLRFETSRAEQTAACDIRL